jgi:hypothetical protein
MNGFGGYQTYYRGFPDRFASEGDTLMTSLYTNFATEEQSNGKPNGHFCVTKVNAERVSKEVL